MSERLEKSEYVNDVQIKITWDGNDMGEKRIKAFGIANLFIKWDKDIDEQWRSKLVEKTRNLFKGNPREKKDPSKLGKDVMNKVRRKYEKEYGKSVVSVAEVWDSTIPEQFDLHIRGFYKKRPENEEKKTFITEDSESDYGKQIRTDFKRYVSILVSTFMQNVLKPLVTNQTYELEDDNVLTHDFWDEILAQKPTVGVTTYVSYPSQKSNIYEGKFTLVNNEQLILANMIRAFPYQLKF